MRKATLSTALALLTIMSTGCEPRGTQSGPVVCTVVADTPAKVRDQERMTAKVRFRCEAPGADELTIKLRFERRNGERWHSVASRTYTFKGKDTYAQGLKYNSREIVIKCGTGTFRTVVDWSRRSEGNTKSDNLVSGTMRDPCKPLLPLS